MKNSKQLFLFFLLLVSFSSVAQTYEVRRIDNQQRGRDYGTTIPTTDLAQYVGGIQSQMQAKYEYNHQKISDKLDDISLIIRRLNRNGFKANNSQRIFLDVYREFLPKIDRIDFTDNVAVSKVMSNLRYAEEEILTW